VTSLLQDKDHSLGFRTPLYPSFFLAENKRGVAHERWKADKVPEQLDAIVIGAGMSGLSCAGVLARLGKRVLVLEQHTVAGGGMVILIPALFLASLPVYSLSCLA